MQRYPAWLLSSALHFLLLFFFFILLWKPSFSSKKVNFEVLVNPKPNEQSLSLQPTKPKEEVKPEPVKRSVFGVSRKAITTSENSQENATVKQGNTLAKDPDSLKLNDQDADSLPIPADEYLVSRMPILLSEVRIPYPEEARRAGVEGPVIMDLLIDLNGIVRKVDLVSGPGYGLNEAATQAIKNFKFQPAQVDQQAVAVRIRYSYRFVLENK